MTRQLSKRYIWRSFYQMSYKTKIAIFVFFLVLWNLYQHFSYPKDFVMDLSEESQPSSAGVQLIDRQFVLNRKPTMILSGAMHYFRVVPEYWKDRMLKMKAGGLNTLETYVPWNVHEPLPGKFDFEGMLNLRKYLEMAQEIGLYVIFRPGPFICSEWDFGGLPSWLLKDPKMEVRTNYAPYQEAVTRFFEKLLPMVNDLQFSKGGPIIAVQVENEFGSYSSETDHLLFITKILRKNGIVELLVTSDNDTGMKRAPFSKIALPTANFKEIPENFLDHIKELNKDFPLMVMEYWSGWFDHWGSEHNGESVEFHEKIVSNLLKRKISINFYMYHGGTNFGFMAGANYFAEYKPDVTSYDYDAMLSEAGDLTPKYVKTRELILEHVLVPQGITNLPEPPKNIPKAAYGRVEIRDYLSWNDILDLVKDTVESEDVLPMEMLTLSSGYGQSYGYIVYRKTISNGGNLKLPVPVHDRAQVFLNGIESGVLELNSLKGDIRLKTIQSENVLDIVVENHGRVNYVNAGSTILNEQRKGLSGTVTLDSTPLKQWKIFPLDFNKDFIKRLKESKQWLKFGGVVSKPAIYRTTLIINGDPTDTFLNMQGWKKGIVIINGFNLGRYWHIGPQKTLYVPGPILREGANEILVFEQHHGHADITFQSTHDLGILVKAH